jgi:hypothetical protein
VGGEFPVPGLAGVTDESAARQTEIAAGIVGMRLGPAERPERLAALGAIIEAAVPDPRPGLGTRLRAALPEPRELGTAIGWGILAIALVVALIAVTLAAASLLLMGLWYLLRWLAVPPRWIRGGSSVSDPRRPARHSPIDGTLAKTTSKWSTCGPRSTRNRSSSG